MGLEQATSFSFRPGMQFLNPWLLRRVEMRGWRDPSGKICVVSLTPRCSSYQPSIRREPAAIWRLYGAKYFLSTDGKNFFQFQHHLSQNAVHNAGETIGLSAPNVVEPLVLRQEHYRPHTEDSSASHFGAQLFGSSGAAATDLMQPFTPAFSFLRNARLYMMPDRFYPVWEARLSSGGTLVFLKHAWIFSDVRDKMKFIHLNNGKATEWRVTGRVLECMCGHLKEVATRRGTLKQPEVHDESGTSDVVIYDCFGWLTTGRAVLENTSLDSLQQRLPQYLGDRWPLTMDMTSLSLVHAAMSAVDQHNPQ